jgi:hypothetical protein
MRWASLKQCESWVEQPNEAAMVTETASQECNNCLRSELLRPADEGYEVAWKVFNAV